MTLACPGPSKASEPFLACGGFVRRMVDVLAHPDKDAVPPDVLDFLDEWGPWSRLARARLSKADAILRLLQLEALARGTDMGTVYMTWKHPLSDAVRSCETERVLVEVQESVSLV